MVSLSTYNITSWTVTDSSGSFSIEAYGPDVRLYVGADEDGDSTIDYDDNYPKRYTIRDVTGDTSGVSIDLSGI